MKTILSAAAALAIILGSTTAFAESGDGPQFGLVQAVPASGEAATVATAAPLTHDVDNEAEGMFTGEPATVSQETAALLPFAGDAAPLQTANSLPVGFGTPTVSPASHAPFLAFLTAR